MKKIQISPSILSADFSQLGKEIKRLEEGREDYKSSEAKDRSEVIDYVRVQHTIRYYIITISLSLNWIESN